MLVYSRPLAPDMPLEGFSFECRKAVSCRSLPHREPLSSWTLQCCPSWLDQKFTLAALGCCRGDDRHLGQGACWTQDMHRTLLHLVDLPHPKLLLFSFSVLDELLLSCSPHGEVFTACIETHCCGFMARGIWFLVECPLYT